MSSEPESINTPDSTPDQSAAAPDAQPQAPSDSLTLALAKIAEMEKLVADSNDRALRALAESENTRRRLEKEKADASKFAAAGFARDLLSVADNLRRAIDAIPETARAENDMLKNIIVGIEATEREMLGAFARNGIRKIEPMDQPFDPNFHEVMFEAAVPGKMPGTVVQILEPGYVLHERLLRPARVGVAKGDPNVTDTHVDREV